MKKLSLLLTLIAVSMFMVGCSNPANNPSGANNTHTEGDGHGQGDHEGHDHGEHEGHDHASADHTPPHGGHLIELGHSHEYHAELLDDHTSESVTIYIMDGDMKSLSIEQASVSLVLTAGDNTQTFELLATQPGGSSEFKSNDEKLMELIEMDDVKGKLRVTIDGKPYSGSFVHHGHGHDHDQGSDSHAGHNH